MMLHIARLLALGLSIVIAAPAPAQPLTGVLKRIKDSGEITLGHRDASVSFSYLDDKQQPVGYRWTCACASSMLSRPNSSCRR